MVSLVSNWVWFLRFSRELGMFSVFRRSCLFNTNDKSKFSPNIFLSGQPYTVLPLFGITYRFWRLSLKANFPKVPSNITIPIAELSSPTREICRPTTSHLSDDAASATAPRRSHRDGNQPNSVILPDQCLFCKKSKYKAHKNQREAEQCAGILCRRDSKSMCFSSCKTKH